LAKLLRGDRHQQRRRDQQRQKDTGSLHGEGD
jgi:hypothetical protein